MRAVVQRVTAARVEVNGEVVGSIERGLVAFVGIGKGDGEADARYLVDKITTLRDQLAEYRSRSGELHAQVVTLKAVRTGGDLMNSLKTKLGEMAERQQKTTIAIVDAQEKLMLLRVKFQNQLADLKLGDATKALGSR